MINKYFAIITSIGIMSIATLPTTIHSYIQTCDELNRRKILNDAIKNNDTNIIEEYCQKPNKKCKQTYVY
jgi:hypothetical protein